MVSCKHRHCVTGEGAPPPTLHSLFFLIIYSVQEWGLDWPLGMVRLSALCCPQASESCRRESWIHSNIGRVLYSIFLGSTTQELPLNLLYMKPEKPDPELPFQVEFGLTRSDLPGDSCQKYWLSYCYALDALGTPTSTTPDWMLAIDIRHTCKAQPLFPHGE